MIVRCRTCGHRYLNPRPLTDAWLPISTDRREPEPDRTARSTIGSSIAAIAEPRVLSFDSACGIWLREVLPPLAKLDVRTAAVRPGHYDLAIDWYRLERHEEPAEELRLAYRALAPGGALLLAATLPQGWGEGHFGSAWVGDDAPGRISHFAASHLAMAVQAAGLRFERATVLGQPALWQASAERCLGWKRLWRYCWLAAMASWLARQFHSAEGMLLLARKPG